MTAPLLTLQIIISPLTRRAFDANGKVIPSLKTQRELAIEASKTVGALFLDLNKASSDYANRLGKEATQKYNRAPGDISHLNTRGSVVFARMVADLVSKQAPALRKYVIPDEGLSGKLASGKPA